MILFTQIVLMLRQVRIRKFKGIPSNLVSFRDYLLSRETTVSDSRIQLTERCTNSSIGQRLSIKLSAEKLSLQFLNTFINYRILVRILHSAIINSDSMLFQQAVVLESNQARCTIDSNSAIRLSQQ